MIIYSTISLIYLLFEECPHFHASGGNFLREMIANGSSSIPGKMNGQGTYKYN